MVHSQGSLPVVNLTELIARLRDADRITEANSPQLIWALSVLDLTNRTGAE